MISLSRERVRQLEAKALAKLRASGALSSSWARSGRPGDGPEPPRIRRVAELPPGRGD